MTEKNIKSEAGILSANIAVIVTFLYLISVAMIFLVTGDKKLVILQTTWYLLGVIVIILMRFISISYFEKYAVWLYGLGILMLAVVLIFGKEVNGAKRWLDLGVVSLQTSEFMKIFFILYLAKIIAHHREKKQQGQELLLFVKVFLVLIVPLVFIFKQPDLGTAIVFLLITCGMLFIGGLSKKIIAVAVISGSAIMGGLTYLIIFQRQILLDIGMKNYQFQRIDTWIDGSAVDADSAYNVEQAVLAVGSGGYVGNGMDPQVYVPERHTDFIFSMIGETTGLIGSAILIILYFFLMYYFIRTCFLTKTLYHTYVITGILIMMSYHMFQNIAMNIGLMPVTGIPLPFISYGGSAILANMLSIAIILSIQHQHYSSVFGSDPSFEKKEALTN